MAKDILFKGVPMVTDPSVTDGKILLVPKPGTYGAYGALEKLTHSFWSSKHEGYNNWEKPATVPFSGVVVHDYSEQVPFGHGMLTALSWLLAWWKHGMAVTRYIAVGKGDLDRYAQVLAANAKYTDEPGFLAKDPYYFKGFPVREHDHRAGYYLLVCY